MHDGRKKTVVSRLRFTVRTLLLVVSACAVLLAYVANDLRRHWRDAKYANEITMRGGQVGWWGLRVERVSLRQCHDADTCISLMGKLSNNEIFEMCDLAGSDVTDKGLQRVVAMEGLTVVNLANTNVSDAGILCLAKLRRLEELNLLGTRISRAAVREFRLAKPGIRIQRGAYWPEAQVKGADKGGR